jgi:hypothetical protein
MYSDFIHDEMIEMLAFEDQRHFVFLLCMKNAGSLDKDYPVAGMLDAVVSKRLGIFGEALVSAKRRLVETGLIDANWQPTGWDKRQFVSDANPTNAERQKRYREAHKSTVTDSNVTRNVTVTLTDTDTDTDTDKKNTKTRAIAPPDGVTDSVWQDFKAIRKTKKAAITQTAINKIRAQAAKAGVSLQIALETCCERGWASFNADWIGNSHLTNNTPTETTYQRSKRELYERATGQHTTRQAPPFVEVLGALQ